jgi:hypothetical protein
LMSQSPGRTTGASIPTPTARSRSTSASPRRPRQAPRSGSIGARTKPPLPIGSPS